MANSSDPPSLSYAVIIRTPKYPVLVEVSNSVAVDTDFMPAMVLYCIVIGIVKVPSYLSELER
ncbi:hypothetical protein ES703_70785 [subsurface metagenome]